MELRKDYLLNRWVIIAANRKVRPMKFSEEKVESKGGYFFCPGNEHLTPEEIGRVAKEDGSWDIRWFPNKYAVVDKTDESNALEPRTDDNFFTFASAFGSHEVIVETPNHEERMHNYSTEKLMSLFRIYSERINELEKEEHVKYVELFKNEGASGGASLTHSHTQVISLNIIPPILQEMLDKNADFCRYCSVLEKERVGERRCFEDENCLAFTPYASRFNYELWIFPKRHVRRIEDLSEEELRSFVMVLDKALDKVAEVSDSYNIVFYYAPQGRDLHFHIQILPRISKFAGFEFESGITVNVVSPEDAAKFYRE